MKQLYALLIGFITVLSTNAQQYQLDSVFRTYNGKQYVASQKKMSSNAWLRWYD